MQISFTIPGPHGPALKTVVDQMYADVEAKAEKAYDYLVEDAVVGALNALGALRAAVNRQVAAGDPFYPRDRA